MINWVILIEINILDLFKVIDIYLNLVIGNFSSNFFCLDKDGKIRLDLVIKVDVLKDGLIYIVILCKGLKWLDGSKFIVKDFVYLW